MSNEKKSGNILTIIIIVLLAIIIVGGGAFAGYYIIFGKNSKSSVQVTQLPAAAAGTVVSSRTYNLGESVLNLADDTSTKYIKVTIYVGYENKKLDTEFDAKKAQIRDTVNSVLRAKKAKDFTPKGTEDIKKEILDRINPMLTSGRADNLYFYDILVQ